MRVVVCELSDSKARRRQDGSRRCSQSRQGDRPSGRPRAAAALSPQAPRSLNRSLLLPFDEATCPPCDHQLRPQPFDQPGSMSLNRSLLRSWLGASTARLGAPFCQVAALHPMSSSSRRSTSSTSLPAGSDEVRPG